MNAHGKRDTGIVTTILEVRRCVQFSTFFGLFIPNNRLFSPFFFLNSFVITTLKQARQCSVYHQSISQFVNSIISNNGICSVLQYRFVSFYFSIFLSLPLKSNLHNVLFTKRASPNWIAPFDPILVSISHNFYSILTSFSFLSINYYSVPE